MLVLNVADMAEYEALTRELFFADAKVEELPYHGRDGSQQGVAGGRCG